MKLLILVILFISFCSAGLLSIGLGSESYKIAVFQSRGLDIVLNDASQRKNPVSVAFYKGDHYVGVEADQLITRAPENVFQNFLQLLGRTVDDPIISPSVLQQFYPYTLVPSDKNFFQFSYPEGKEPVRPEVLMALILAQAKEIALKNSGVTVLRDIFITVPPSFTHQQRTALLSAAHLAQLESVTLVNENTAVAMMYGLDHVFSNDSHVLFYDMGSSTTTATLVQFQSKKSSSGKNSTNIVVLASSWDENLGGRDFTERLTRHFAEILKEKEGKDFSNDHRVMARLRKEAKKAKEVLSANTHTIISIEGLIGDNDFTTSLSRETFEELCSDLFVRAVNPISKVLEQTKISAAKLHAVEIVGGGLRIPRVQSELQQFLGRPLDRHMNGDESAVLGAAYLGALESGAMRGREFKIKDVSPFSVEVHILSDQKDVDKTSELFHASKYGAKKSVTFNTNENFTVNLLYKSTPQFPRGARKLIGSYSVEVPLQSEYNHTGEGHVKAVFHLTSSGLVLPDKIESEIEIMKEVQVKIKKNKVQNESKEEPVVIPESSESNEEQEEEGEKKKENLESESEENIFEDEKILEEEEEEEEEEKPEFETKLKKIKKKVPCKFTLTTPLDFTLEEAINSKKFLNGLKTRLIEKRDRAQAVNSLEAFIYEWKTKLEDDSTVQQFTNEEQRDVFSSVLSEVQEWFEYTSDASTPISTFREKLSLLQEQSAPILFRISENKQLPSILSQVISLINQTRTEFITLPLFLEISPEQITAAETSLAEFEQWLVIKGEEQIEQDKTALWKDPILTSRDIATKWQDIEKLVKRLKRSPRKKPVIPDLDFLKNMTDSNSTDSNSTDSNSTDSNENSQQNENFEKNQQEKKQEKDEL